MVRCDAGGLARLRHREEAEETLSGRLGALDLGGSRGERLVERELAGEEKSRVDDSHPTTALRIRLVQQRPWSPAAVAPDSATWARIEKELAPTMAALATRARDDARYGRR